MFLLCFLISGCSNTENVEKDKNQDYENLPVLKVVGDSEEAMALLRMEEDAIARKYGVRLEYYYPEWLSDNLEDFLFASDETYDIYILFPAKIPAYVEKDLILPLDRYTSEDKDIEDIIPIYRKLYMQYDKHVYGMV